jgi:transposase
VDTERLEQALAGLSQKRRIGEPELTDAQRAQIAALLPPRRQGRGRPRSDDRRTLEAILYVLRTGCAWSELPAAFGDEATAHRRWREWQASGLWARIAAIVPETSTEGEGHAPASGSQAQAPTSMPHPNTASPAIIETRATIETGLRDAQPR